MWSLLVWHDCQSEENTQIMPRQQASRDDRQAATVKPREILTAVDYPRTSSTGRADMYSATTQTSIERPS
jgi:hypothetical protein